MFADPGHEERNQRADFPMTSFPMKKKGTAMAKAKKGKDTIEGNLPESEKAAPWTWQSVKLKDNSAEGPS